MKPGYCFLFNGSRRWRASSSELWETVIYNPTGTETLTGTRLIDGRRCTVFKCADGKFRAVTAHNTI